VSGERRAAIPPTAGAASPPLLRRLAGPAFWSTLGAGASRILAVGAAILVARELGAAGFGELNLVQTTAGMLMALGGFGLNTTATKLLAGKYRADPLGAGRVIVLSGAMSVAVGSVTAVLLVANAGWVAREVLAAPQLEPALVVAALLLVVSPLTGTQIGVLMGLERFRSIAVVNTAAAAASIPLLVVGTRLAGMLGAVAATVATALLTAGIQWVAVGRAMRAAGIRLAAREAVREWRLLFSYSVPLTLSNVLLAPVAWATSALIAHQAEGLSELGLFAAANQWRNAIVLLATSAGAVVFPLFSHLHDSGRPRSFARAFWTSAGVTGGAALLVAAILAILSPALMHAYGTEFRGASDVLVVLVLAGAVAAPLTIVGHAIAGAGRMWLGFGLNLLWACTLVAATYGLRSRGALGLSIANLVAYGVHLLVGLACVRGAFRAASAREATSRGAATTHDPDVAGA